jgi:hypothetical protein
MNKLKIDRYSSYKIGVSEVRGLEQTMRQALQPVLDLINDRVYWGPAEMELSEYKSRDGFISYNHNLGGIEISLIVPSCEADSFTCLEIQECDYCAESNAAKEGDMCGYAGKECGSEADGHLDSKIRVWLKLEELNTDTGEMRFWLYLGGGNGDAPYFRTNYEQTYFEAEFTAKSLPGVLKAAKPHIKNLMAKL